MIPTAVADPGLVQRDHVRVALGEHHPAGLGGRRAREGDAVEHLALVVEQPVGGVQVLRPGSGPPPVRSRAEAADATTAVAGREHDPGAKTVQQLVGAPAPRLRQADRQQLLVGESGATRATDDPLPGTRGVADPELAQGLLG